MTHVQAVLRAAAGKLAPVVRVVQGLRRDGPGLEPEPPGHLMTGGYARSLPALGEEMPVRGIVVESPGGIPAAPDEQPKSGPLGVVFYYLLVTPENAADFLARWAIRPTPPKRPFRGQPPRIVSLFRPGSEPEPVGWHLAVRGDGTRAHVDSPDGSAVDLAGDYDIAGHRGIGLELIARGTT